MKAKDKELAKKAATHRESLSTSSVQGCPLVFNICGTDRMSIHSVSVPDRQCSVGSSMSACQYSYCVLDAPAET